MNRFKFGLLALAIVGFMMSCKNDSDVRDAAAQSVTATDATQPGLQPTSDALAENAAAGQETATVPTGPTTSVQYSETEFDFGTIDQGDLVTHEYKFKNTGNEPLIINSAKGSCGCTVPSWPKEPIAPGKEAVISVQFDSKGKSGAQNKKVTITANTNPQQSFLYLKGTVNAPQGAATGTPAQ
ncbi:MAG: DUF1573 domain-containing protein [Saprospirales bacterium]|nr:DUF1573 domain-containing protein [Saprospirales bacterium]MBK8493361.1 DUF1573 domain-containing protein [Saprospirales bacterium]